MSQHISFNVGRVAALCSSISHSSQRSVRADVVVIEVLLQLGSVLILLGSQPAGIEDWGSFKLQVLQYQDRHEQRSDSYYAILHD